ncbi:MAG: FAD-binding oxidoreductase [Anaerolineae bacterium]
MLDKRIIEELKKVVGEGYVLTSPEDLLCYSYDGTFEERKPDVVVLPRTTAEVAGVMEVAWREEIPVVPRGMASGLAAGSVPFSGGITLSLTRMTDIIEIDEVNMTVTAQAGVITADLQAAVEEKGLFYPPDPSSVKQSTIGGNVACNAGGPRCLKYGVTRDYVQGMEVVLADGRVLRTGGKPIKKATGYALSQLFTGSEGTLGIITEVTLRLLTKPAFTRTAMAIFPSLDEASRAVNAVLSAGILPATLEIVDEATIHTIEEYMHLGLPLDVEALLILEADGNEEAQVSREIERVARICREGGASEVKVARDEAEEAEIWRARRSVSPSLARRCPNKLGEDISVPRSAIPEAVRRIKAISQKYNLPIAIFGHAGDGNLHPNILFDRRDPEEWERVQRAAAEIFAVALELGGTLSGEHGVGVLKRDFLEEALGPLAIEVMWSIKHALDPKGILNPGKIFPESYQP